MTSPTPPDDEFYLGYAKKIPPGIRKFLFIFVPALMLGVLLFSLVLPGLHNQYTPGKFGRAPDLQGLLLTQPVPHLVVLRPGQTAGQSQYSRYLLSGLGKTYPSDKILALAGQWVQLTGTPIYRDSQTLIAARSATPLDSPPALPVPPEAGTSLGTATLNGEILDAKCFLGAMKPGQTKIHRKCAIRCISGGVPPLFRVRNQAGDALYFVLADAKGEAVNRFILDKIADPIQIKGEVVRYDDMFVLKADPTTYKVL